MSLIFSLLVLLWTLRIMTNILSYAHLWYVKEYRFDRMLVHLRTPEGRAWLFPQRTYPPRTMKAAFLVVSTLGGLLWGYSVLPHSPLLKILVLDILTFPVTFPLVFLLGAPTRVYHVIQIARAIRKLRSHKKMIVVGITGSYGKTSTKDYLATILSKRWKTLKTEASKNSAIGIAEAVLGHLTPETEVFVVEMGAYKRGEIAEMAAMMRPEIGILTAINPQHQDLFGSMENTMKAKYELLEGLTGKRIAIVNADDRRTRVMGEWARRDGCTVLWWSKKISNIPSAKLRASKYQIAKRTFLAQDVNATLTGVEFICVLGNKKVRVQAPVLGEHQVSNILAAIAGAVACGMDLAAAAQAASRIKPTEKVMQCVPGINGSVFINDTFNNNPDAAKAALAFLTKSQGRKVLVFQPMIELGEYAESSHEEVGECAARVCDDIILTNKNFLEGFLRGVRRLASEKTIHVLPPPQAADYIRKIVKKDDTVLFKGKEAEHVLRTLTKSA